MKKIFLVALALRLLLSLGPYHPDLGNHLDWGVKFWQLGPRNFYENVFWQVSWANQPPGTIYLFALTRQVYEAVFSVFWWLNMNIAVFPSNLIPFLENRLYVALVKLPFILADLGLAWLVGRIVSELKGQRWGRIAALVVLFNPVFWYVSAVWGQTDGLVNLLGLGAVYLFYRQRPIPATALYLFSLFFKGSLIIFMPLVLLLLIRSRVWWWKKVLVLVGLPLGLAYLSYPFVRWMGPIPWLYHLYRDRIFGHQGNMLTANAFNLWALIYGIDFSRTDLTKLGLLTLKHWGWLLLALSSIPIWFRLFKHKLSANLYFWAFALLGLNTFIFLTNMHERYLYPAMVYLTILLFTEKQLLIVYLLLSLIWWLNLYHLWYVPNVNFLRAFLNPLTVRLLSLTLVSLTGYLLLRLARRV